MLAHFTKTDDRKQCKITFKQLRKKEEEKYEEFEEKVELIFTEENIGLVKLDPNYPRDLEKNKRFSKCSLTDDLLELKSGFNCCYHFHFDSCISDIGINDTLHWALVAGRGQYCLPCYNAA